MLSPSLLQRLGSLLQRKKPEAPAPSMGGNALPKAPGEFTRMFGAMGRPLDSPPSAQPPAPASRTSATTSSPRTPRA